MSIFKSYVYCFYLERKVRTGMADSHKNFGHANMTQSKLDKIPSTGELKHRKDEHCTRVFRPVTTDRTTISMRFGSLFVV
jgi:hypothetical protein